MWQGLQWESGESQLAIFTALFAAKWAEIKALWWLCSPRPPPLHHPSAQVDESFRKPQSPLHFSTAQNAVGHRDPSNPTQNPPSRSKRITNQISMWYIHYCKILCCSPLKAHHPLPSLKHQPPHHHHHHHPNSIPSAPPQPPFRRPLTLAVLNWAKSKFNISGGRLGCLKSSLRRAATVIAAVTYAPVKQICTWLHSSVRLLCCEHNGLFLNHKLRNQ